MVLKSTPTDQGLPQPNRFPTMTAALGYTALSESGCNFYDGRGISTAVSSSADLCGALHGERGTNCIVDLMPLHTLARMFSDKPSRFRNWEEYERRTQTPLRASRGAAG